MPNETMIKLGLLSKKSPIAVEKMYDQVMEQLKKTNPIYKKYTVEKSPQNKTKIYSEFMGIVMTELKKKLGINKDLQVEDSSAAITTSSVGSPSLSDGTTKAPFDNSSIFANKIGSVLKREVKNTKGKSPKVKKKSEKYLESYFDRTLKL